MSGDQTRRLNVLIVSNLYPVPWDPNRASFNKQQFDKLGQTANVKYLLLVPLGEWWRNRSQAKNTDSMRYAPYLYIPKVGRIVTPFLQFFSLLFSIKWVRVNKIDVILASWLFPDAIATNMFAKLLSVPCLGKAHGTDVNENAAHGLRRSLMRRWLNKSHVIFCASQALKNKLIDVGINENRVAVNYNGVDKSVFFPVKEQRNTDRPTILFVGNLIETKGVNELLDAAVALNVTHSFTLNIVGKGPLLSKIQASVKAKNLDSSIKCHGSLPLPKVAEMMRNASLLVLPSYREGVPNVLLEACASGIPVIATDVGGIPEVVSQDTGIVVPAKDAKALKVAMESALEKSWDKEKIKEHAMKFDWDTNLDVLNEALTAATR